MRHDHREDRRHSIQDRGLAGGDMPLPPDNQDEGQHIVEESHDKKGPPDSRITRQAFATPSQDQQKDHRGNRNKAHNNGENRKLIDSDTVRQERTGPDKRQCQQQDPLHQPHLMIDVRRRRHLPCLIELGRVEPLFEFGAHNRPFPVEDREPDRVANTLF